MQALVECEKDSIDLSGDMGAVGRVVVSDSRSGHSEMCLDLKGMFCSNSPLSCIKDDPSCLYFTIWTSLYDRGNVAL